jgi:hypothetical protein
MLGMSGKETAPQDSQSGKISIPYYDDIET